MAAVLGFPAVTERDRRPDNTPDRYTNRKASAVLASCCRERSRRGGTVWRGSTTSPWRPVYGRVLSVTLPVSRPEPQRPANDNDEDKTDPSVDHHGGSGSGERYAATNESDNQCALDQPDPARKQRSGADHGVRSVRDHDPPRSHVGDPALGGPHGAPVLRIMEWRPEAKSIAPSLVLCDQNGVALHEITDRIESPPDIPYTAYLTWAGFAERAQDLLLADMGHPTISPIVDAAREAIRSHLDRRVSEQRA
jgi:hypothetical protein